MVKYEYEYRIDNKDDNQMKSVIPFFSNISFIGVHKVEQIEDTLYIYLSIPNSAVIIENDKFNHFERKLPILTEKVNTFIFYSTNELKIQFIENKYYKHYSMDTVNNKYVFALYSTDNTISKWERGIKLSSNDSYRRSYRSRSRSRSRERSSRHRSRERSSRHRSREQSSRDRSRERSSRDRSRELDYDYDKYRKRERERDYEDSRNKKRYRSRSRSNSHERKREDKQMYQTPYPYEHYGYYGPSPMPHWQHGPPMPHAQHGPPMPHWQHGLPMPQWQYGPPMPQGPLPPPHFEQHSSYGNM